MLLLMLLVGWTGTLAMVGFGLELEDVVCAQSFLLLEVHEVASGSLQ